MGALRYATGGSTRRGLMERLRNALRPTPQAPPEAAPTGNLPDTIPPATPPATIPSGALNPQMTRRGFLGNMGSIAARAALPSPNSLVGRAIEAVAPGAAPPAGDRAAILRELDRYIRTFGTVSNRLDRYADPNMDTDPRLVQRIEQGLHELLGENPRNMPPGGPDAMGTPSEQINMLEDALDLGSINPYQLNFNLGERMAQVIATRAGTTPAEVSRVLGDQQQLEQYLAPMIYGRDDFDFVLRMNPDDAAVPLTRDELIRTYMPDNSTLTSDEVLRLWRRSPQVGEAIGPEGIIEHFDSYEPFRAEYMSQPISPRFGRIDQIPEYQNREVVARTIPSEAYPGAGYESHPIVDVNQGDLPYYTAAQEEQRTNERLIERGLMRDPRLPPGEQLSLPFSSPARGPQRPMEVSREGDMTEAPPWAKGGHVPRYATGGSTRRGLMDRIREALRGPQAPAIITRESENLPAVIQPATPPAIVRPGGILNPQMSRRGFLGNMGQIAARAAMPRSSLAETFTAPMAREDIIRRELERYTRDFGDVNRAIYDIGAITRSGTIEAPIYDIERQLRRLIDDPSALTTRGDDVTNPYHPEAAVDAYEAGAFQPHMVEDFGGHMARAIARRTNLSEAEVRRVLGNPEQYEHYLMPNTRSMDSTFYPDAPHQEGIIRRDDSIRSLTPEGSLLTPRQMEDLWRNSPDVNLYGDTLGPQGLIERLDAYEPHVAESAARGVGVEDARTMHPHISEETWREVSSRMDPEIEEWNQAIRSGNGARMLRAWNQLPIEMRTEMLPDVRQTYPDMFDVAPTTSRPMLPEEGDAAAQWRRAEGVDIHGNPLAPARGPRRPMTIDEEGNMLTSPPFAGGGAVRAASRIPGPTTQAPDWTPAPPPRREWSDIPPPPRGMRGEYIGPGQHRRAEPYPDEDPDLYFGEDPLLHNEPPPPPEEQSRLDDIDNPSDVLDLPRPLLPPPPSGQRLLPRTQRQNMHRDLMIQEFMEEIRRGRERTDPESGI